MSTSTISRVFAKFGRVIASRLEAAIGFLAIAAACASAQPAFVSNDFDGDGVADVIARQRAFDILHPVIGEIVLFSGATKAEIRRISSDRENDLFGYAVSAIGDIDGDNVDDIAVGAPLSALLYEWNGRVDVFSGVDGDLLLQIEGSPGSRFGRSVGPAGDMNGDGVPDFLVGAYIDDAVGRMCIVYAHSGVDGQILRTFGGEDLNDGFGAAVLGVGDWNADGFPEIAITAPALLNPQNKYGRLYIFNGAAVGTEPDYIAAQTASTQVDGDGAIKQIFGRNLVMGLDLDADGNRDLAVLSLIDWSGSGVLSVKAISRTGTVLSSVAAERKLAGDVDKSMDVVIADLLGVLNGFGLEPNTVDPFSADSDGDGIVDSQDINAVLSQFGTTSSLKDVLVPGGATSTALAFPLRASDDCDLLLAGIGEDCCANCPPTSLFPCGGSSLDPLAPGDPIDDCDTGGGPRPPGGGPRPPRPGNPPSGGGCNGDDNNDGIANKFQNDDDGDGTVDASDCDSDCFIGDMSDCVPDPIDGGGWSGWPSAPPAAWDPPPPPSENGQCVERVYIFGSSYVSSGLDGRIVNADYPISFAHRQWAGSSCSANITWLATSGTIIENPAIHRNRYVYLAGASIGPGSMTGTCQCGDTINFTLADIALEVVASEVATGDEYRPIASYVFVNNDDDDFDGIPDMEDPDVDGEDDLYELRLGPAQGINPAQFNETKWRLVVSDGLRVWYRPSQGNIHADLVDPSWAPPFEERVLDGEVYRSFPLGATIHGMPRLREYLLEAVSPSATTTSMAVYLGFGGTYQLQELDYEGNAVTDHGWYASTAQVVAAEIDISTRFVADATSLSIGHWGTDEPQHSLSGYDHNDALLNDQIETFIDTDPDHFKVTVRDASRNLDPTFEDQIVVEVSTTRTFDTGAPVDDDPTVVRLVETGPDTGIFDSELMLLVTRDLASDPPGFAGHWADDDLAVWSNYQGAFAPDDGDGDRTHRADLNGAVVIALAGDGPDTSFERRLKVNRGFPAESATRTVYVVPIVHMEPYRDTGYDEDGDPNTLDDWTGANNGEFDWTDLEPLNGRHDPWEPSEQFRDLSVSAAEINGGVPPDYTYGHEPVDFADGYGRCYLDSDIDAQVERANIAWAQAEIRVVLEGVIVTDAPLGPGGVSILDDGYFDPDTELWDSVALVGPIAPDRVYAIFTGVLLDGGYGISQFPRYADLAHPLAEYTFVMIESLFFNNFRVLAHELGHALTNLGDAPALGINVNPPYVFFPSLDTHRDHDGSFRRILHVTEDQARTIRQPGDLQGVGSRLLHE